MNHSIRCNLHAVPVPIITHLSSRSHTATTISGVLFCCCCISRHVLLFFPVLFKLLAKGLRNAMGSLTFIIHTQCHYIVQMLYSEANRTLLCMFCSHYSMSIIYDIAIITRCSVCS